MPNEFTQRYETLLCRIEAYLQNCFIFPEKPQQTLFEAMRYSLLAGGKRLRPVLCMEFCRLCGGEEEEALPFAAAVEMVHTYSLIHDDLPCMDDDDLRRGKPTCHKMYGEATAVLAGDGLLTAAFTQLAASKLSAPRIVQAVGILSECAGECGMVGGQVLDMEAQSRTLTQQEVLEIQTRKTGRLISAACCLGVTAAGGKQKQIGAAAQYANMLGLAFQIQDDILDVEGDAEKLGKATGMDGEKNTFVRLYGLAQCHEMVEKYTRMASAALDGFGADAEFLQTLARQLSNRDH